MKSSFIKPAKFDLIVEAVRSVCGYQLPRDGNPATIGIPSLALKLGNNLRKCAAIIRGFALRRKDSQLKEDVNSYLELHDSEWASKISSSALYTLSERKFNKPEIFPVASDLVQLREFQLKEIKRLTAEVTDTEPSSSTWSELAAVTLTRLILFNKRRGGEAARLQVERFRNRPSWGAVGVQEIQKSLNPTEQELCKRLDMVEIKGKKGRKVPVLLTVEVKEAIDALIKTRSQVGIHPDNRYVFARVNRGSRKYIRGWDCLKAVATRAKVKSPELITSTKLRKYIATVCQIIDMTNSELDWLAKHLGHDITVHRDFYRLQESTLELAKVSKLLIAVDEGKAAQLAGKTLNEIDFNEIDFKISPEASDRENSSGPESDSKPDDNGSESLVDNSSLQPGSEKRKKKRTASKSAESSSSPGDGGSEGDVDTWSPKRRKETNKQKRPGAEFPSSPQPAREKRI